MRGPTDALRSLRRFVWCVLANDTQDFAGNEIEWEVRYWSTEAENRFPFVRVAEVTPASVSGGSAVQRDLVQTFAVHAYPMPQLSPEAMVMEASRVEELFLDAFELSGISYVDPLSPPAASALVAGSGGTLAADSYVYNVTAVNGSGESLPSPDVEVVVSAGGYVQLAWWPVAGAASYRVYRRGSDAVELLVASPTLTAWADMGAAGAPVSLPTASAATATIVTGPRRVPLYDYSGVPLDGVDSATSQRGPSDFMKVVSLSVGRMDDPQDDRFSLVAVEPRLTWRRTGRIPPAVRVTREVVLSQDPS